MARESMDVLELLRKRGLDVDVDFLREALGVLVKGIMDAEVSAKTVAGYGECSADRVTQRNGYGNRSWDTTLRGLKHELLIRGTRGTVQRHLRGLDFGQPALRARVQQSVCSLTPCCRV